MHGGNLSCFFHLVGIAIGQQSLAHAHNIYIGVVLSEKIIIILKNLKESCQKIWWIEKYVVSL